jgi:xylan 1,4-beta-xylosidase
MGIANQLRNMDSAFKIIASFPELKSKPIVIGESDPDGCAACQGDQLGYRNGTIYASYTAATFARELDLADQYGVNLEGALTWAFEFENEPPFAGFRVLASDGIDLPVLNVFRMFAKMDGRRVAVESTGEIPLRAMLKSGVRDEPDVSAIASRGAHQLCILAWHYHDDEIPGATAQVKLLLDGLDFAKAVRVRHFRIDDEHSNAFTAWKAMNAPMPITPAQARSLQQAGQLAELEPAQLRQLNEGKLALDVSLPRNAISLFILDWE